MSRFSLSSRWAAVAVVAVIAIAAISGVAIAQDGGNQSADEETETYEIAIDEETRVVSSDWDGATVTIVIEADSTRQITVTDASQRLEGAVDIKRERVTVPSGERVEIEFTVANGERPAVTVGTRNGLVGLGDQDGGANWFAGEPGWSDVHTAALGGGAAGLSVVALAAWAVVARDPEDSVEDQV